MQKKLLCGLAPLLAVAAFMVVPAMASAAQWYACAKVTAPTGTYKTIKCNSTGTPKEFEWKLVGGIPGIPVISKNVSGKEATLEVPTLGGGIKCKTISDVSIIWNEGGVGKDYNNVAFTECKTTGGIKECAVAEPINVKAFTALEEKEGKILNKYTPPFNAKGEPEPFTAVTLSGEKCPAPGTIPVTGVVTGEAVAGTSLQKFPGAGSELFLGPYPATFEAETEQEGALNKEGIKAA